MKILVACEESQRVTIEMRRLGHEAYSCDIQEPSGGHPEWHIHGDALKALRGGIIKTMDGETHVVGKWDMMIAHPPCTHLAVSGARWFAEGKKPLSLRKEAADFFLKFAEADIPKIAVENPVSVMFAIYRKPDQIIHPWQYGHLEEKTTCLWLKGLPKLMPTNNVREEMVKLSKKEREKIHYMFPGPERAKERSKTFPGIARAMAEQWAGKNVE
nr:MAG TPA: DNA (cytosine-5)-methyltransferase 3A [Caudoviricetes sp.]